MARINRAGKILSANMLKKFNPNLSEREIEENIDYLYKLTKGTVVDGEKKFETGIESKMFKAIEKIIKENEPKTPFLKSSITNCLKPRFVGNEV